MEERRRKIRGKFQFWLHFTLIVLLIISTLINLNPLNLTVNAPVTTKLSVTFQTTTGPNSSIGQYLPGSTFNLKINVEQVNNLFGFEFKLKYKGAFLNATSIILNTLWWPSIAQPPNSGTYLWTYNINNTVGYAWYAVTLSPDKTTGLQTSSAKTLVTIPFKVVGSGGCILYLFDTVLTAKEGVKIAHTVSGAQFVNTQWHDIGITSVKPSSTKVIRGKTTDINIIARNHGNNTETFDFTVYANTTTIRTETVTDLAGGTTKNLTLTCDTSGLTIGTYIISANATTVSGETDTTDNTYNRNYNFHDKIFYYVTIRIIDYPIAAFTYKSDSPFTLPFANHTIIFNASDSNPVGGEIIQYYWDWGYTLYGIEQTAKPTYPVYRYDFPHEGTYNVTLTVIDDEGLNDTTWKLINIYLNDVAVINVTASPTTVTKGESVSINVTVKNIGKYNATFDVTPYYNGTPIVVNPQTVTNLTAGANKTLTFTWNTYVPATTSGTPYQISASTNDIGPYEANKTNNSFIDGNVIVYKLPGRPSANFTYSPTDPIEGQLITFNASGSAPNTDTLAPIISYAWNFSDGTTEIYVDANLTDIATHSYAKGGLYIVNLNITDNKGFWDATEAPVNVSRHDIDVVSVTLNTTTVIIGESVSMNVTVTNEGNFNETFNVKAYYNNTEIVTINVLNLTPTTSKKLTFTWSTINVNPGAYKIKANATIVTGEIETDDNEKFFNGTVTLKFKSTISINVTTESITFSENIIIYGNLTPLHTGVTVTIQYLRSGERTWINATVPTNATSQYSYTWTPTKVGTFYFKTIWPGDDEALKAESDIITVTVSIATSHISINVTEPSITLGSSITISGALSPVRENVNVTIQYKPSDGTWNNMTTVPTNASSQYSYKWTPTTFGTYELKARWLGDANMLPAESNPTTLTVKVPPIASFTYTPSAPKVGDTVTFTSNSTDPDGSIQSWDWNFGDGTPHGNTETVTHTYATAGDFTVNLTVTDNDELTDTKSITITVSETPPPPPPNTSLYLIAAIVAIVIIASGIAAYALIKKKP